MTVTAGKIPLHKFMPGSGMAAEALDFEFFDSSDIVVTDSTGATLVLDTDYSITGDSRTAAASITPLVSVASGVTWYVRSITDRQQQSNLETNKAVDVVQLHADLDRSAMIDREQDVDIARGLKVPLGEAAAGPLPAAADRASKVLGFDTSGDPIAVQNDAAGAEASALSAAASATASAASASASAASAANSAASATAAATAKTGAETAQAAAETARDAAIAAIAVDKAFTDTTVAAAITAGLAATASGDQFVATGDDVDWIGLYEDSSGTEVLIFQFAKIGYIADLMAGVQYADTDGRRISENIYKSGLVSGTLGTYTGADATVAADSRNYFFLILDTLDPGGNITVVIRPPSGTTFYAVPVIALVDFDGTTSGGGSTALQGDGTYVWTGSGAISGKPAAEVRVLLDSRTLSAITAEIMVFEGDAVPTTAKVATAISTYADEADANKLDDAAVRSKIKTFTGFENHLAGGEISKTWILNQAYANCVFVDYEKGNDANAGTFAAPLKTFAAAAAVSSWVALKAGQRHIVDDLVEVTAVTSGAGVGAVVPYGSGPPPIVDGRKDLSGETWAAVGGRPGVYSLNVTLADGITTGGTNASSSHFAMYLLGPNKNVGDIVGERLTWQVGGASISDNLDAVEAATVSSFTVHAQGQTDEDPRDGSYTGTDVTFYVRLLDDDGNAVDPNGENLCVPHMERVFASTGCDVVGIDFIGNLWKDLVTSNSYGSGASTRFNNWIDVRGYESAGHFIVGPANIYGYLEAHGRPIDESANTFSGGAAVVAYTTNDYSATHDLFVGARMKVTNMQKGHYAHGSGNDLYRSLIWLPGSGIEIDNCSTVFHYDATVAPVIVTRNVQATNAQQLAIMGGSGRWDHYEDERGKFSGYLTGSGGWAALAVLTGDFTMRLRNIDFDFPGGTSGSNRRNHLIARSNTGSDPTIIFDGCRDVTDISVTSGSEWVRKGIFRRATLGGIDAAKVNLVLVNTQLGDLCELVDGTNYPASLTVDADSTFGMGSRTGGEVETALTGAGITYSIDHDSTVVALNGQVLSAPGW